MKGGSSMSLYNLYRPDRFSKVCGQDETISTLVNQLHEKKHSHAYIFQGTRGTGKTSTAKILAMAVNCLSLMPNGDPCGTCKNCLASKNSLDIIELDGASNNGVDDIRKIKEACNYPPSDLKYKVFIIDEVHMLSKGAFNALLKTIEEPPSYVLFILATTEIHKIPATIRSRCMKFEFKRIQTQTMIGRMQEICSIEGKVADIDALRLIAQNADGAMRDALSMLEQSFYLSDNSKITEKIVANMVGCENKESLQSLAEAILREDSSGILSLLDFFSKRGKDPLLLMTEVLSILRDAMMLYTDSDYELEGTAEYIESVKELVKAYSLELILSKLSCINKLLGKAKYDINPFISIQTGLVLLSFSKSEKTELLRLEELEDKVSKLIDSGKVVIKEVVIEKHSYLPSETNIENVFNSHEHSNHNDSKIIKSAPAIENDVVTEAPLQKGKDISTNDNAKLEQANQVSEEVKANSSVVPSTNTTRAKTLYDEIIDKDSIFLTFMQSSSATIEGNKIIIKTIPPFILPIEQMYGEFLEREGVELIVTKIE